MKKRILVPLAGWALFLAISDSVNAQGKNNIAVTGIKKYYFTEPVIANPPEGKMMAVKRNEVSIKAIRDFAEASGQTENEKWYKSDEGFMAYYN
jgi:hypothetical protein